MADSFRVQVEPSCFVGSFMGVESVRVGLDSCRLMVIFYWP
jgi:hypothetical protein